LWQYLPLPILDVKTASTGMGGILTLSFGFAFYIFAFLSAFLVFIYLLAGTLRFLDCLKSAPPA
jgi:hypothetical protein